MMTTIIGVSCILVGMIIFYFLIDHFHKDISVEMLEVDQGLIKVQFNMNNGKVLYKEYVGNKEFFYYLHADWTCIGFNAMEFFKDDMEKKVIWINEKQCVFPESIAMVSITKSEVKKEFFNKITNKHFLRKSVSYEKVVNAI